MGRGDHGRMQKSKLVGEIVNAAGEGKVSDLKFEECSTCPRVTPTVPIAFAGEPSELGDGNGTLSLFNTKIVLSECFGSAATCTVSAASIPFSFTGGNPAEFQAINAKVKLEGVLCGTSATWSATYVTSMPATGLGLY